jgi:hypothetical protein
MDLLIGAVCLVIGACVGFLTAALLLMARDLDAIEEYEDRIAGR